MKKKTPKAGSKAAPAKSKEKPPFFVGQRVICVNSWLAFDLPIDDGKEYQVKAVKKRCCDWYVDVGFNLDEGCYTVCKVCQTHYEDTGQEWFFRASRFVPIEQAFKEVPYSEIADEAKWRICIN